MARRDEKLPNSEVKGERDPSTPEVAWKAPMRDYGMGLYPGYPEQTGSLPPTKPQPGISDANLKDGITHREKISRS